MRDIAGDSTQRRLGKYDRYICGTYVRDTSTDCKCGALVIDVYMKSDSVIKVDVFGFGAEHGNTLTPDMECKKFSTTSQASKYVENIANALSGAAREKY